MSVAFEAVNDTGSAVTFSAANSVTFAHTVTSATGYLRVSAGRAVFTPGDPTPGCTATYNGVSMNQVSELKVVTGANNTYADMFELVAPATGTHNVVITVTTNSGMYGGAGSVSYTGVDQTTPSGSPVTASGTSAAPSITVSSNSGDMISDCLYTGNVNYPTISTPTGSKTQRFQGHESFGNDGASQDTTTSGSVAMDWSLDNVNNWIQIGAKIIAAGTTGQSVTPGLGTISYNGLAPSVSVTTGQSVTPGLGTINYNGLAPTLAQTANQTVTSGLGQILYNGLDPTVTVTITGAIVPGSGTIVYGGLAPTLQVTANQTVSPGSGSIVYQGLAPDLPGQLILTPDVGTIVYQGLAPIALNSGDAVFGRSGLGGDDIPRRRNPNRGWNREEYERRKLKEDEMLQTLQETYTNLTAPEVPQQVVVKAEKIVEKHTKLVENLPVINWEEISRDYERVRRLTALQQQEQSLRDEEIENDDEEVLMMLYGTNEQRTSK